MITWFNNGPHVAGTARDQYPKVTDFMAEPVVAAAMFGVHMRWVSPSLGTLTDFPWWDHLERRGSRLDETDWSRPWTEEDPFMDADQDWALTMWADDDHIYVHSGPGFDEMIWYRVPRALFESEIARFRSTAHASVRET